MDYQLRKCPALLRPDLGRRLWGHGQGVTPVPQGRKEDLTSEIEQQMLRHAENEDFERAASLRDQLGPSPRPDRQAVARYRGLTAT